MNRYPSRRARSAGFTLIEALVALVVMAFGMLALAGFQSSLSTASDTAKQRSEAVRLAQQKLEELRAFQQKDSDGKTAADVGNIFDYVLDVVSGGPETLSKTSTDVYNTANPYTRQWWITKADGTTVAAATDPQKWMRVAVSWTDRTGQSQTVTLQSVISRSEPADLGTIGVGPGTTKSRTPKNRSVDIPYPSKQLTGGKSSFQPPNSSVTYVFDNLSGNIVGQCSVALNDGDTFTVGTNGCAALSAYLLSGYIHFLNNIPSNGNPKIYDQGVSDPSDDTKELTAAVLLSNPPMPSATPVCFAQRRKVVTTNNTQSSAIANNGAVRAANVVTITTSQNLNLTAGQVVSINDVTDTSFNGLVTVATVVSNRKFTFAQTGAAVTSSGGTATLLQQLTIDESASSPPGYSSVISRFVTYTCIIQPWDHDSVTATPERWWGRFVITPQATAGDSTNWSLGSAAGTNVWKVCRFSGDYIIDNKISNAEHPLYYRGVSGALDNQNYVVIPAGLTCPTDGKVDPLNDNYVNVNTVLHQVAAGSTTGGAYSTDSTQWSTTAEPASVPTLATQVWPMF